MLDVMLIDDEVDIRERLIAMVDWTRLGLRLCAQAADGETARELYLLHRPKILITDIKIPIANGLTLAEEFLQLDPELQIIVITGYNDFSYAQTALRIGVSELLLKPIFPDAINRVLEKAVDYFELQQKEKASSAAMRKLLDENIDMIRETFLANLLHSKSTAGRDPRGKLRELGLDCPGPYYAVALCGIPKNIEQYEANNLLVESTAQGLFQSLSLRCFTFFDNHFRLNMLFSLERPDMDDVLEEALNKLKAKLSFMAGVKLYVGIGGTADSLAHVCLSFDQALAAYRYQNILNDDTVIHYKNILSYEDPISASQLITDMLAAPLRQGDQRQLEKILTDVFMSLVSGQNPVGKMLDLAYSFVAHVGGECSRQNINTALLPSFSALLRELGSNPEPKEILSGILRLSRDYIAVLNARRADSRNSLIAKAKAYMQENLSNSLLSMEDVGSHIGLSRAYFCALFHKEMGVSFSNYLKNLRIEEAKRLLRETNLKVLDIAASTGFASAKYFSYVFKQTTGKTPVEFQKSGSPSVPESPAPARGAFPTG